jgi:magnesium-transporting ATPase (P-type)
MATEENRIHEGLLKGRYIRLSKIMVLFAIIYSIWIAIIIISVYFFGIYKLAVLTMDQWILSGIGLIALFVVVNILFIMHYYLIKRSKRIPKKPKQMIYKGKKLHIFTLPQNSKGGIFSKTFITIDENTVLNLRFQMIQPNELWNKNK